VRIVPFGWIAFLIFVYILLAGPGDYFLVRKLLRRMELTWLSFAVLVVAISGGGYLLAREWKGTVLRANKIDLVDVDVAANALRGTSWFTLYSPRNDRYELSLEVPPFLDGSEQPTERPAQLSWFGLPEDTIGGMYKRTGISLIKRGYQSAPDASRITGVPIQIWSTKSFMGRWDEPAGTVVDSDLASSDRNELSGSLTLRLPAALEDCVLAYGERAYQLGTVAPNLPMTFGGDAFQHRNLESFLTQRALVLDPAENERYVSRSTQYDRTGRDWDRLMQMLLYYQAAGGRTYTGLRHDYLWFADLSSHLPLGRALLVGKYARPAVRVHCNGGLLEASQLNEQTYVRLVLPVNLLQN